MIKKPSINLLYTQPRTPTRPPEKKHTDRLFQSSNSATFSLPFSPESPLLSVEVVLAASDIVVPDEQGGLHTSLKSVQKRARPYLHTFRRAIVQLSPVAFRERLAKLS